ncbi:hypothetical protein PGTUg99_027967 [Puccinia graminis f. sp. tritici]|uniref:Metallo-beta-lactamase domain-containing protein n=1 Tax=Puccinia graminis f. sp. tritici TaxID=56615 RepID=A0A5B0S1A2_PUCGR|nr:hypothetical protein PGTUg99_027967 [Puccinia graminis f. sp. tritici]
MRPRPVNSLLTGLQKPGGLRNWKGPSFNESPACKASKMNSPVISLKKFRSTIFNNSPTNTAKNNESLTSSTHDRLTKNDRLTKDDRLTKNDRLTVDTSSSSKIISSSAGFTISSSASSSASSFVSASTNQSNPDHNHPPAPNHHLPNGAGFRNPWPSANSNQSYHLVNLINNGIPLQLAKKLSTDLKPVRTLPADLKLYANQNQAPSSSPLSNTLVSTWLGHAGYLVQFPMLSRATSNQKRRPFRILFDPMFSIRAGPTQWTGPKRLKPSPCHIKQIPTVDICFISHSHYDHLDYDTIQELSQRQPHLQYFVPLGLKAWFDCVSVPSDQVVELDWWQSRDWDPAVVRSSQQATPVDRASTPVLPDRASSSIRITCVPAQHSSGRSLMDQNTSLWCGWIVEQIDPGSPPSIPQVTHSSSPKFVPLLPLPSATTITSSSPHQPSSADHRDRRKCCVYFAGDTGYRSQHDRDLICPAFKEIGEKFGPIDFSMIPIWRGGSLSFVSWAGLRVNHSPIL